MQCDGSEFSIRETIDPHRKQQQTFPERETTNNSFIRMLIHHSVRTRPNRAESDFTFKLFSKSFRCLSYLPGMMYFACSFESSFSTYTRTGRVVDKCFVPPDHAGLKPWLGKDRFVSVTDLVGEIGGFVEKQSI